MTRLEMLCKAHNQQGGTIHDFNRRYKADFLGMTETVFLDALVIIQSLNRKDN